MTALEGVRICDFGGQLAGAGATKILAAFGAEVIRVEDPVTEGRWDALRGIGPFVDERRGVDLGGGFNNHNVGKLGVTIDLRQDAGRELLRDLVSVSDVVAENFAAGVLERRGFGYDVLRRLRPDVVYLSNCGFGHTGPYRSFKTWGPIVQAVSGLSFTAGFPGEEPAGWGFSYMDHGAACLGALAVLAALHHRDRTGDGQWIDLAATAAGITLLSTEVLDWTVNQRAGRRPGEPHGNRADHDAMCPHGAFPAEGEDSWVAVACRGDDDWRALAAVLGEPWTRDVAYDTLPGRLASQDAIEKNLGEWTRVRAAQEVEDLLVRAGVPVSVVRRPSERVDAVALAEWGLFPTVDHPAIGTVRVEGLPMHLSVTDWSVDRPAPCLGEHNDYVFGELLGRSRSELAELSEAGVI